MVSMSRASLGDLPGEPGRPPERRTGMALLTTYVTAALLATPLLAVSAPTAEAADKMCGGLVATIVGTPGDDVLTGTTEVDVIAAGKGDDRVEALAGNDFVCGGEG